jgi:hypothetical protein
MICLLLLENISGANVWSCDLWRAASFFLDQWKFSQIALFAVWIIQESIYWPYYTHHAPNKRLVYDLKSNCKLICNLISVVLFLNLNSSFLRVPQFISVAPEHHFFLLIAELFECCISSALYPTVCSNWICSFGAPGAKRQRALCLFSMYTSAITVLKYLLFLHLDWIVSSYFACLAFPRLHAQFKNSAASPFSLLCLL